MSESTSAPQPSAKIQRLESAAVRFSGSPFLAFTDYLKINTAKRYEILDITDHVGATLQRSKIYDGTVLISTMHITSSIFVNDHESGLWQDIMTWLEKLAPAQPEYLHHQTGEDNADAHLKRMILGHQVLVPVTRGKLDLGPWERVHYGEFDGCRDKRIILKVQGLPGSSSGMKQ